MPFYKSMDYSSLTGEEIIDRFDNSPDNIRELLEASSTLEIVRQVCRSNYLTDIDKMVTVEQLTALVLLGFLLPDELGREVTSTLHLNHKAAQAISEEIGEKIFSPIKEQLKKIYAPIKIAGGIAQPGPTFEEPVSLETLGTATRGSVQLIQNKERERAIERLRHASIQEKVEILKEATLGGYVAEIPNLQDHLKENEFNLYNEGKTYQNIADESGLSLKKLVDTKKDAPSSEPAAAEVIQKISSYFKRLPEPGELDSFFKNPGIEKYLPLGLDQENLKTMQAEIVRGAASGFSPEVLARFFLQLIRKGRLENFAEAAKKMALKEGDFAPANLAWISNQAAQPMGIGREIFGLN